MSNKLKELEQRVRDLEAMVYTPYVIVMMLSLGAAGAILYKMFLQ